MGSPPLLDFEALLAPIPGENPGGELLRYAGPYDEIQEARRSDDALDQGEWVREVKVADWQAVIAIATEALATRSKDLQIAAWLVEALVKQHGIPGLRDGLHLLWELQERFWESLYPEMEEEDLEFRAAPLVWLNDKLPISIRQIPVTQMMGGDDYSWLHWKESREVDNLGRRDQEAMAAALAEGKISGEQFDKAVDATPLPFYQTLFADLQESAEEYARLDQVVEEKFGRDAPSLSGIKAAIEDYHTLVADIIKKKGGLEPEQPAEPPPSEAESPPGSDVVTAQPPMPSPPSQTGMVSLEPQSRADALRRLAAVAEYFRRTEPHSPVSYLVQRAVRWGEMPLEQWLQDVIHDESVLNYLRETLGLQDTETGDT